MTDSHLFRVSENYRNSGQILVINSLIISGIHESGRNVSYECIPKEIEALKHAMSMAEEGTFITALSDVVSNAIDLVQEYQAKEILDEGKLI